MTEIISKKECPTLPALLYVHDVGWIPVGWHNIIKYRENVAWKWELWYARVLHHTWTQLCVHLGPKIKMFEFVIFKFIKILSFYTNRDISNQTPCFEIARTIFLFTSLSIGLSGKYLASNDMINGCLVPWHLCSHRNYPPSANLFVRADLRSIPMDFRQHCANQNGWTCSFSHVCPRA